MHTLALGLVLLFSLPGSGARADADPLVEARKAVTASLKVAVSALAIWQRELESAAAKIAEADKTQRPVTIDLKAIDKAAKRGMTAHDAAQASYKAYRTLANRLRRVTPVTLAIATRIATLARAVQQAAEVTLRIRARVSPPPRPKPADPSPAP